MANLIIRDDYDLEERYTPEEMYHRIEKYFYDIDINKIKYNNFTRLSEEDKLFYIEDHGLPTRPKKPTSSGLALFLGFPSRRAMNSVQQDGAYALIIERGISMIEEYMEEELYSAHCGGAKFWLKNHGWVESQPRDFGMDKTFNVMIDAEIVADDKEKEKQDLIELKENLNNAGLDTKESIVEIEVK